MGENGQRLIAEKYADNIIASKMNTLYRWIIDGADIQNKPEFIHVI